MTLTDKHIDYENECRQMFVGQKIRAVIYGEVKYFANEDGKISTPDPYYKTRYPDLDSLDHAVYFKTDNKSIYIFWDNTFVCYGLQSRLLELTETTNDYEQKWDVSAHSNWAGIIGQEITDFKINWEEARIQTDGAPDNVSAVSPQTFEVKTENGKIIILSAAELMRIDQDEICPFMDNLLLTTNVDLARRLRIIQ